MTLPVQSPPLLGSLAPRGRPGERREELLLDLGLLSERDMALEVAVASGRPFVGLRGFMPDARLFLYVPLAVAMRERVCPLVRVGGSLKVATVFADPDLSCVERRLPSLRVDLVVAPRGELLEVLNRAVASL